MSAENTRNSTLKIWNAKTSLLSLLFYIFYFIVYRLSLNDGFAYAVLLLGVVNIGLIVYTLFLAYKCRDKEERLSKNVFFGLLRMVVNLLLVYLVLDYLNQQGAFRFADILWAWKSWGRVYLLSVLIPSCRQA